MSGHAKLHPYLKTFDELKRSMNRMQVYLDMHKTLIPAIERQKIERITELLEHAISHIPEEYHVSRYKQFRDNN